MDFEQQNEAPSDAEKARRIEAESEAADLLWLMKSARGRRIVWRDLSDAGVFHPVFDGDHAVMCFREGRRNQGLRKLNLVMALPDRYYVLMMQEAKSAGKRNTSNAGD